MKSAVLLILGFSLFGCLLGLTVGISSAEITNSIITALLAFFGAKVFLEFENKTEKTKMQIGGILVGFSLLFIVGLLAGISIKVNRMLSFTERSAVNDTTTYLRKLSISRSLEEKFRDKDISCEEFLDSLINSNRKQE